MNGKVLKTIALLFLVLFIGSQTAEACSIVVISLRKDFREAHDVFLGEVISVLRNETPRIKFKVLRSWKGRRQAELEVNGFNSCSCPNRKFEFVGGKQFIAMTFPMGDEKALFFEPCATHVYQIDQNPEEARKTMKRLDNFWFRAFSRIYPF